MATVKVIGNEEYFSINKRITFSMIFWYIVNNGSLVDSRRHRFLFPSAEEWSILLQEVYLPNGKRYRFMADDLFEDVLVPRFECFYQVIDGSVLDGNKVEQALTSALPQPILGLTTNNSIAYVAYLEEYIKITGASATVVFYVVKTSNQEGYSTILDASTVLDEIIPIGSLASKVTFTRPDGSAYVLLNNTAIHQMIRYVSRFHLFLKQRPRKADLNKFAAKLTNLYKDRLSNSTNVTLVTVEEFVDRNGSVVWGLGYSLTKNGKLVWPDSVEYMNSSVMMSTLDVFFVTDKPYTLMLNAAESFSRAEDLYWFYMTSYLAVNDISEMENLISQAFKQEFPTDFSKFSISTDIIAIGELLTPDRGSVYKVYFQLMINGWPLLAQNHDMIDIQSLSIKLSNFHNFSGAQYRLWTGDVSTLVEVSSLSSVVMNRPLFPDDELLLEAALKTELRKTLQRFGISVDQFSLSIKRQMECITLTGLMAWEIDFSASLAGEQLFPGLLPMEFLNASYIESILHSIYPKYQVIDLNPTFLYVYEKGFRILMYQKLNLSSLIQIENALTEVYESVYSKSEVKVRVAALDEVILKTGQHLVDMPTIWQVIYYVTVDGWTLNGKADDLLNASFINSYFNQSNWTNVQRLLILDEQSVSTVRVEQCLKLLFVGLFSVFDFMPLGSYLNFSLLQSSGFQKASATVLRRVEMISHDGLTYTEVQVAVEQGGTILDAATLNRNISLENLQQKYNSFIKNPDSQVLGILYQKSSLFSVGFWSPVIGIHQRKLLERYLSVVYEEMHCGNASVHIIIQFESLTPSGSSVYINLYTLSCNGMEQDAIFSDLDIDNLWAILSSNGFPLELYDGNRIQLTAVDHLLGIPFTTYVSPADYQTIQKYINQTASREFGPVGFSFHILDQRNYVDKQGNVYYILLCSSTLGNFMLNAIDFIPLINKTEVNIETIIGPSGAHYQVASADFKQLKPFKSAVVVYFEKYLSRTDESSFLSALLQSVGSLEEKFDSLSADIYSIDRVVDQDFNLFYRYIIFVMSNGFVIDMTLEPPVNVTFHSAMLTVPSVVSVNELHLSFHVTVYGFVASSDVPMFEEQLQAIWNRSFSGFLVQVALTDECVSINGETVTRLSYFVFQNGHLVDPTSVQAPNADDFNRMLFSILQQYMPYSQDAFLLNELFSYMVNGDTYVAMIDWQDKSGSSLALLKIRAAQHGYGPYGSTATRICYSAYINGTKLLPGRDPNPISNQLSINQNYVMQDSLYSLTFYGGNLTRQLILALATELQVAWTNFSACHLYVNIYGVAMKLTASAGITTLSRLYYGVTCNGTMLRPVDRPAPSMDIYATKLSLRLYVGEAVELRYVVFDGLRLTSAKSAGLIRAIQIAWNISGNSVKVKIPIIPHQAYTNSNFAFVTKAYYAVTLQNDSDVLQLNTLQPNSTLISQQLKTQGLTECACSIWHAFRIYSTDSATKISGKFNAIINALWMAWYNANPDINKSLIVIRLNWSGEKAKRSLNNDITTDTDGNTLTALDYQVSINNRDPDPFFIQYPSDSAIAQSLQDVASISICTSCILEKCGSIYISGMVSDADQHLLAMALSNAFVEANQPDVNAADITISIEKVLLVKDSDGNTVSQVNYCVIWNINSTILDLTVPSFDEMYNNIIPYGKTLINPSMMSASNNNSDNTKIAIIVACCVGGFVILCVVGLIIGIVICRRRKSMKDFQVEDKKRLSASDSDSFVGHGLYNPSHYGSLDGKQSSVSSKMQFRESAEST